MLLETILVGSVLGNALIALSPSLKTFSLSESITDNQDFTISLVSVGPEVTIVGYSKPSELEVGKVPTVTVNVRHNRTRYEYIFARIRDLDTNTIVCPMKKKYVQEEKDFTFTFQGLGPAGDWAAVMPNRNWNLRLEVGLWWL